MKLKILFQTSYIIIFYFIFIINSNLFNHKKIFNYKFNIIFSMIKDKLNKFDLI